MLPMVSVSAVARLPGRVMIQLVTARVFGAGDPAVAPGWGLSTRPAHMAPYAREALTGWLIRP